MNDHSNTVLNEMLNEAADQRHLLFDIAEANECKKTLSNLRQVEKSIQKLKSYQDELPLTFNNRTICRLLGEMVKLFTLIIFDLGDACPRTHAKWFSRWSSGIIELMSGQIPKLQRNPES